MYVLHTPQIDWLEAALAAAPEEEQGRIGRWLERAVMEHDKLLLDNGLGHTTQDAPDGLPEVPVFTRCEQIHVFYQLFVRQAPILGGSSEAYEESLLRQKEELSLQKNGGNVSSEDKGDRFMSKSFLRAWFYGQNTTIALCNEKAETTSASLHTSIGLHHNDPYLRLGPFKYQLLSSSPHVAIFRDFFSAAECDGFIQRARNNLQSTPYQAPLKSGGYRNFFLFFHRSRWA